MMVARLRVGIVCSLCSCFKIFFMKKKKEKTSHNANNSYINHSQEVRETHLSAVTHDQWFKNPLEGHRKKGSSCGVPRPG